MDMVLIYKIFYFFFLIMSFSIAILFFALKEYDGFGIFFSSVGCALVLLGGLYFMYGDAILPKKEESKQEEVEQQEEPYLELQEEVQ